MLEGAVRVGGRGFASAQAFVNAGRPKARPDLRCVAVAPCRHHDGVRGKSVGARACRITLEGVRWTFAGLGGMFGYTRDM